MKEPRTNVYVQCLLCGREYGSYPNESVVTTVVDVPPNCKSCGADYADALKKRRQYDRPRQAVALPTVSSR